MVIFYSWADINSDEKDVIGDAHTSVKSITVKPDRSVGLLDCGTASSTHWLSAYTEAQISPNYKRNRKLTTSPREEIF